MKFDPDVYWAAEPKSEDYATRAVGKVTAYREWLSSTGQARRALRSFRTCYGWAPDGWGDASALQANGDAGEWLSVTTNDFAALLQQTLVLTTSEKPAFKAVANNTDFRSMAQTEFAEALLDYYDRQMEVGEREVDSVLLGLLMGTGWVVEGWDSTKGKVVAVSEDNTEKVNEGDAFIAVRNPFQVCFEPQTPSLDALQWFGWCFPANRHDLAATKPALREELMRAPFDVSMGAVDNKGRGVSTELSPSDMVLVWEFRHIPSPSLPHGRLVRFVSEQCVLFDSLEVADGQLTDYGYPYSELHAYPLAPHTVPGSLQGHSDHFDLLSIQETIDNCLTQATTAANAGGVTNLWLPKGETMQVEQIVGGLNLATSTVKPEQMEGVKLDPQVEKLYSAMLSYARRRVGMNDAALGEPTKGMPAQLAALLQAQAIQFHSRLQAAYARLVERTRTGLLRLLQRYATQPRIALIAGKSKQWAEKEWRAQDIVHVDRFAVEQVNPVSRTYAGKQAMADKLLDGGHVNAQQYVTLVNTGRLERLWQYEERLLAAIEQELEMLQEGIGLPPVDGAQSMMTGQTVFVPDGQPHVEPRALQAHWAYLREEQGLLETPNLPAEVVRAVTDVMMRRLELWPQMPVVMQQLLGCPPELIQAPMPPGGMPPPGSESGTPAPQPGAQDSTAPVAVPPGGPDVQPVKQPKPPKNPITGEQAPAPMGTA